MENGDINLKLLADDQYNTNKRWKQEPIEFCVWAWYVWYVVYVKCLTSTTLEKIPFWFSFNI